MIAMIAAVTKNGVIGVDGKLPFDYPEDMAHFRKSTIDSIVVMGRKTLEGISKPLPKRENCLVSSKAWPYAGVETFSSVKEVIDAFKKDKRDIWLIGGAGIYEEGMKYADRILLTITPDIETSNKAIRFPWINPLIFRSAHLTNLKLGPDSRDKSGVPELPVYGYFRI